MVQIICDACKKNIPQPVKDINYHILLDQDLCVPCMQKLQSEAEKATTASKAFSLKGYHEAVSTLLRKMCKSR